ncbi:MAG: PIN domain-containing protein [Bryobacterales bacterium]|nr:PIN domain-containing protein [Bryobacterales bacterium]
MIRVVLDTNIVVSALLQPLGPSARIFLLALGGAIQVCVTGAIYAEYEEVIRRPLVPPQRSHHSRRPRCHPRQVPLGSTHRTGARLLGPRRRPLPRMLPGQQRRLPRHRQHQALPHPLARNADRHAQALPPSLHERISAPQLASPTPTNVK